MIRHTYFFSISFFYTQTRLGIFGFIITGIKRVIYWNGKRREAENDTVAILFFQRNSFTKEYLSHH